jgi:hypothetical protein
MDCKIREGKQTIFADIFNGNGGQIKKYLPQA